MSFQQPVYNAGMFDPMFQYWQGPQRFYPPAYPFPPVSGIFPHPPYVPQPVEVPLEMPPEAPQPELRRAQSERQSTRSRLSAEGGAPAKNDAGPRISAFVGLGPTTQRRPLQQGDGRVQVEASVRDEFRTWKREHGSRSSATTSPLLKTPFTQEIINQPYPHDLRVPGSKDYDGRTDPEMHVNLYYSNMLMMGVTDVVMCRAFYSTLSGRAAEWFKALKPGSISCFADLATKFVRKFVTSKTVRKHFMYLEKAKQLEGESLSDFLVKWKAPIGEVDPMDDLTAINMLHSSLRAGVLCQDFILHPPITGEDAIQRVTDYANAGEANAAKRSQETGTSRKPTSQPDGRQRRRSGQRAGINNGFHSFKPARGGRFALCAIMKLTKFAAKVEESKKSSWKIGFKRSDQGKRDKGPDDPLASASKQVIHVIFGGSRQKVELITLTPEDLPIDSDQGAKALVVTIDIMGTNVQRVMVDTGSSVNMLYLEVF
ncbi:PREDICTED: uncharacterized protein LOC109154675 [Ipomoea nil]|uniref:uncharacterized protein LOC109154675 n=1 Tax=Ipomoea nil TaxID=35883 RepID=UPI000901FC61|nr:PREDICTED: uncharacterized protein LOC109154675 [Ipomoea nil]